MLDTHEVFASISTEWTVPSDLPYFEGHFPGNPVFPAVGIVDACLSLLRLRQSDPGLQLTGIVSAKFSAPIRPEQKVTIEVSQTGDQVWQFIWSAAADPTKKFANISLQVGHIRS